MENYIENKKSPDALSYIESYKKTIIPTEKVSDKLKNQLKKFYFDEYRYSRANVLRKFYFVDNDGSIAGLDVNCNDVSTVENIIPEIQPMAFRQELEKNGFKKADFNIPEENLFKIVSDYVREINPKK